MNMLQEISNTFSIQNLNSVSYSSVQVMVAAIFLFFCLKFFCIGPTKKSEKEIFFSVVYYFS